MKLTAARLHIEALRSVSAGSINDDCIGFSSTAAWVIDGATDVLERPLIDDRSDAAWIAHAICDWLSKHSDASRCSLEDLIIELSHFLSEQFAQGARRQPRARWEYPSAAGLIVRLTGDDLEFVSLADCALLVEYQDGHVQRFGAAARTASISGNKHALLRSNAHTMSLQRAGLRDTRLVKDREARSRLNLDPGYGVLSITPPPARYVVKGRIKSKRIRRFLLASDGYMRLVDLFGLFDNHSLLQASFEQGPEQMMGQLRKLEEVDKECLAYPRTKVSDDASVLLASIK